MDRDDDIPIHSGIEGIDEVLGGGLTPDRFYLVEGRPGAGKTTLALQFLLEGVRSGETVLYMTLSESAQELQAVARSHGWSLEGVAIREYLVQAATLAPEPVTMFHLAEVELGETLQRMLADVDELRPARVVLDALSELRLLAETTIRYRRQLLAFKQFFVTRHCTVLLLDDCTAAAGDPHVQSVPHGVLQLECLRQPYGGDRRQLRVAKMRGRAFLSGAHDYEIRRGGLVVFPRLVPGDEGPPFERRPMSSGIPGLDALLGGGPDTGSSLLVMGPAGTGKTTIALQYALDAARRGDKAVAFVFDEAVGALAERLLRIGMDPRPAMAAGRLQLCQVDPVELSPGEFLHRVRLAVERDGATVVAVDSLNGYLNAVSAERHLVAQLHEMLAYLAVRGVLAVLVIGQGSAPGRESSGIDISHLPDTIVQLRYFESRGHLCNAISVAKKRAGRHESTSRELLIDAAGPRLGEPLGFVLATSSSAPRQAGRNGTSGDHQAPSRGPQ
ncbi:MAG: ATPase domain-containing protein [Steroidobacteraceae bacterium]